MQGSVVVALEETSQSAEARSSQQVRRLAPALAAVIKARAARLPSPARIRPSRPQAVAVAMMLAAAPAIRVAALVRWMAAACQLRTMLRL